jgi:hypothetical protein
MAKARPSGRKKMQSLVYPKTAPIDARTTSETKALRFPEALTLLLYCTVLYSSTAVTMTPVHRTDKYLRDLGHFSSQTPSSSSFSSSLVFCLLTTQLFPHCCRQPGCVGISDSVQNPFDLMPATHPETSRFEATALPNLSCF